MPQSREGGSSVGQYVPKHILARSIVEDRIELRTETDYDQGEVWLVDQADFSSVKSFVDRFEVEGGRLDYLILNAAVAPPGHFLTDDGWELRYRSNESIALCYTKLSCVMQFASQLSLNVIACIATASANDRDGANSLCHSTLGCGQQWSTLLVNFRPAG